MQLSITHEKLEVQWELEMLKKAFEKKLKAATEPLNKKIEELKDTVKQAYGYLACVVKAAGMLVYSEDAYKANLTKFIKCSLEIIHSKLLIYKSRQMYFRIKIYI